MKKILFALVMSYFPGLGWAWAQTAGAPALAADWTNFRDLAGAGAALILVLALLVLFLKALKRVGRFKSGRGGLFEMRGHLPLDNRKYLAAVAVDGRLLIIGITPDRLIPLGQWPLRDGEGEGRGPGDEPEIRFTLPAEDGPPDISVVGPEELR